MVDFGLLLTFAVQQTIFLHPIQINKRLLFRKLPNAMELFVDQEILSVSMSYKVYNQRRFLPNGGMRV